MMISNDRDGGADLGPCCICETRVGVTNILMLQRRAPIAGHGWGCVVCNLPSDGAVVVLCDGCMELFEAGAAPLFVCKGYPRTEGRMPMTEFHGAPFHHDDTIHRAAGDIA
jgi:hypothetical protein